MISLMLELIEQNPKVVALLGSVFVWVIGFFSNKKWNDIKKKRLVSSLRLQKKKECRILIPTYKDIELYPPAKTRTKFDVNIQEDVLASVDIISLINRMGLDVSEECIMVRESYNELASNYNLFCIGGILANAQTRSFFKQIFPDFRIFRAKLDENDKEEKELFYKDGTKRGFRWGEGKEFTVKDREHYAIIVRLTGEDLGSETAGTVYILYGNTMMSTLIASKYMLCQVDDLIKRTRKRTHFFLVMKVREVNGISRWYFDENSDLTDEMFHDEKRRGTIVKAIKSKLR